MCHFSWIVGGSFSLGLYSEVVAFSTRLAVQPFPMYKSNGEKQDGILPFLYAAFWMARMALHLAIQVQLYGHIPLLCMNRGHQWTLLHYYYPKTAELKCGNLE